VIIWKDLMIRWMRDDAKRQHALGMMRIVYRFLNVRKDTLEVGRTLLHNWHCEYKCYLSENVRVLLKKCKDAAQYVEEVEYEHTKSKAEIERLKNLNEEVDYELTKAKAEVERLRKENEGLVNKMKNMMPKRDPEVRVVEKVVEKNDEDQIAAALEALEAEVHLREQAELELQAMRAAVLQHTETLKVAAAEDEAMRTDLTMQLERLREELLSRDSAIGHLRNEVMRLESVRRGQLSMHPDAAVHSICDERDQLHQELMKARAGLHSGAAYEQGNHRLQSELAKAHANVEELRLKVTHLEGIRSRSMSPGRGSEMTKLRDEVNSRDSVIVRLREEMVRLELQRLRNGSSPSVGSYASSPGVRTSTAGGGSVFTGTPGSAGPMPWE